jgi:tRNA(Ile2) C34 agmatinyltransferase TiaS
MIVRCGRCGIEIEVAGPGEFICPSCGTRNAVRGQEAPQNPFGVPDLGATPPPNEPAPGAHWVRCPECAYRFAVGDVEEVDCPSCSTTIHVDQENTGADLP